MDLGQQVVLFLCLLLVVWYTVALIFNRRLGLRTLAWLQEGLPALGEEVEKGWIGSANSGARVNVRQAHRPFRRLELVFLLESRELLPLWLFDLLRGKRDQLAIRATLCDRPQGEIEVVPEGGRLARRLKSGRKKWTWTPGPHSLLVGQHGQTGERLAALEPFLEAYGPSIRRISWRPADPHLLLLVGLRGVQGQSAGRLFEDLRQALNGG